MGPEKRRTMAIFSDGQQDKRIKMTLLLTDFGPLQKWVIVLDWCSTNVDVVVLN